MKITVEHMKKLEKRLIIALTPSFEYVTAPVHLCFFSVSVTITAISTIVVLVLQGQLFCIFYNSTPGPTEVTFLEMMKQDFF